MAHAYIVGIDPGVTTGVAFFRHGVFDDGEPVTELGRLWRILENEPPDLIVLESFYGGAMRQSTAPLQVIGGVKIAAHALGIDMVEQSPSILQAWKPRAHLHSNIHVRSAIAHVLYYMDRNP